MGRVLVALPPGSSPLPLGAARVVTHFPNPPTTTIRTVQMRPDASLSNSPPVTQASTPGVPPVGVGQVRYEGAKNDQWGVSIAVEAPDEAQHGPSCERANDTSMQRTSGS